MSASLLIHGPGMWALQFALPAESRRVTFGRSRENDLVLRDDLASSRHGAFLVEGGQWIVEDLGSSNGILVNGIKYARAALSNSDVVRVGNTDITFQDMRAGKTSPDLFEQSTQVLRKYSRDWNDALSGAHASSMMFVRIPQPDKPKKTNETKTANTDLRVAEKLAGIMDELTRNRFKSMNELLTLALAKLQAIIHADNGFLMIPDSARKRWIIRAYVGDHPEFQYGSKHAPIPLTIANEAYKDQRLLTNSFEVAGSPLESPSIQTLDVKHYLAVPLYQEGTKSGLLYFDKRGKSASPFTPNDAELFTRLGSHLLELHRLEG